MYNYRIGVPYNCNWQEVLNSDLEVYGGGGVGNFDLLRSSDQPYHMRDYSIELSIPPLATIFLKPHLSH
jgi:1,4-alpha-glucan branching enzyme